jgi:hypothetical protein
MTPGIDLKRPSGIAYGSRRIPKNVVNTEENGMTQIPSKLKS